MKLKPILVALCFSSLSSTHALAQTFPMYSSVAWGLSNSAGYAILSDETIREYAKEKGNPIPKDAPLLIRGDKSTGKKKPSSTSTRISKPGESAGGIEALVAGYPDSQKPQMRKVFNGMLQAFENVAEKLNVPAHDMGTAAAALVSGSYAAYHNETLGEEHFKPLAQQMRQAMSVDPKYIAMSTAERQRLYQIMVGAGMLFTLAQLENQKSPDPKVTSMLKMAGGDFLGKFMNTNPDSIVIKPNGMQLK